MLDLSLLRTRFSTARVAPCPEATEQKQTFAVAIVEALNFAVKICFLQNSISWIASA